MPPLEREIAIEQVGFEYAPGVRGLEDVTITIRRGAFVALIGGSGSGKTTLLNLLLRLHDPTAGTIRADGRDVRELDLESVRARMSAVLQEPFLFDIGVGDNVRLARPDATDEDVAEACRLAGIDDLVATLPDGYATKAGERGGRFSVGQRQRIAIARALARRPDVLLLDEPTAALDAVTEIDVTRSLRRVARGLTTVYATHRVSTVVHADLVVVMQDGRVVEQGMHDELLAAGGPYRALWQKQSGFTVGVTAGVEPERLRDIPALASLSPEHLAEVAGMFDTLRAEPGDLVAAEGEPGNAFYLIARGRVAVSQRTPDGDARIGLLDDGDYFGEIALLREASRTATVRAVTPTTLLVLPRAAFLALLDRHPAVRENVHRALQKRLEQDAGRLAHHRDL